jgi:sporulation-control protein spo0M
MSLFQKLGVKFGIGSVKLAVGLAEPAQFRGRPFHGAVLLEGGATDITLMMLTVDLTEFWVTGSGKNRSHHRRNHGRVTLAENLVVPPGFRQEFPFEMVVPDDARCTRRREGWTVDAEAHIAMAVDARSHAVLKVVPQPEILAVQRAARDGLGFTPVQWQGSFPEIFYDFAAPPHLREKLDGIALRLHVTEETVAGDLILNRQEQGLGGFLGAVVGADKQTIPFLMPRSELLSKRGTPNPGAADRYLRELLHRAGIVI